jgi:hypothetical protein
MERDSVTRPKPAEATENALILLVEPEETDRRRVGGWLEAAGYSVMDCPGPKREDFTCLGVRGERCALVEMADLAILDGRALLEAGTDQAATHLLRYYLASDKPVLVLADGIGAEFSFEDDRVAVATRASRTSVLTAVRELFDVDRLVA